MLIRVTPRNAIPSSEITDESVYRNRRQFLREAGLLGVAAATVAVPKVAEAMERMRPPLPQQAPGKLGAVSMGEELRKELTDWEDVTTYNNFYEFGTSKEDPAQNAKNFKVKPWTVKVDGMVK